MVSMALTTLEHFIPNDDGWLLHVKQVFDPARLDPARHPIVVVPGYGMNAWVFGFHPAGTSLERTFAEAGHEVWSVNLRAQGQSRARGRKATVPSLRDYAEIDLPAALDGILTRTRTNQRRVVLVGCSLGGTIAYAYMALSPENRVAALVAIGSPLRWVHVNPILRLLTRSPGLVARVPTGGTRRLARVALPIAARIPGMLNVYMNTRHVDLEHASQLVQTVENPHPALNTEIAHWLRRRDLVIRGVNITERMAALRKPLLVVASNRDGIVPQETARFPVTVWGGDDATAIVVGTADDWYAHADLFIGRDAPRDVFHPIISWLAERDL